MEEFQGIIYIPYIDDVIDFTSEKTEADTYNQYIGKEVTISDTQGDTIIPRLKKNCVETMATQLEQALINLVLINIYMSYINLTEILQKITLTLLLIVCSHKLIPKVIIIRYFMRSAITHLMGLISNGSIDL